MKEIIFCGKEKIPATIFVIRSKYFFYPCQVLFFSFLFFYHEISFSQNISINTTGAANSTSSMLEVLQPSGTSGTSGLFVRHSGSPATAYGLWVEMTGAPTNKYAIIVPSGSGKVGIGLSAPSMMLDVTGSSTTAGDATIQGASTGNAAVYGVKGSVTSTTNTAAGIFGLASGASGQIYGVLGQTASTTGNTGGVRGYALGTSGATFGVWGENSSASGYGVFGNNTYAGAGGSALYGVYGSKQGNATTGTGYGVYGTATNTAATNIGGYFTATGATNNYGIIVPSGGGSVGIGTSSPIQALDVNLRMNVENGVIQRGGTAITTTSDLGLYSRYSGNWMRFVTNAAPFMWYTDDGIGSTNRMQLDASGNLSVPTGYLKVGNPSAPQAISSSYKVLLSLDAETSNGGWGVDGCGTCDNASNNWEYNINTATSSGGYLFYDPDLQNSRKHLYTPWIWVPVSVTSLNGFIHHETIGIMEALYDGVSLEYSVNNGTTWTQVPSASFTQSGYNGTAEGYNQACSGINSPALNVWNSTAAQRNSEFALTVTGAQWIRFRFVGTADAGVDDGGSFRLYSFALSCVTPAFGGGAFAAGNIYAQYNVYAGSNVLQGDVAEYFKVEDSSTPGDLICMSSVKGDAYSISEMAYNPFIIGIHSTNPTVTLNTPVGTPVSLTGRVPVNVSAENGAIKIGDYLTASAIKGHAMKADKPCYIIGRALEKFDSKEKGKIICLVETGWYNPNIGGSHSGGSFYVKEGQSGVIVNDPSVKKESRIFLTFKNKTGAEYWVSEINNGAFTISFDKTILANIPFDYFVDNANANSKYDDYKKNEEVKGLQTTSTDNSLNRQIKELPEYHNEMPPSLPSDVTKGWVWSPQTGFKLSDHFINSKE